MTDILANICTNEQLVAAISLSLNILQLARGTTSLRETYHSFQMIDHSLAQAMSSIALNSHQHVQLIFSDGQIVRISLFC